MKLNAFVIDDSKVMRRMVMNNLKQAELAEFSFIEAENGEDALEKLERNKPDIFFVDWNMPKMSGIDLIQKLRTLQDYKEHPIIMVTSEKGMDKVMQAIDEAEADEYICKPFTKEDFQRKVGPLLDKVFG